MSFENALTVIITTTTVVLPVNTFFNVVDIEISVM